MAMPWASQANRQLSLTVIFCCAPRELIPKSDRNVCIEIYGCAESRSNRGGI